MSSGRYKSRLFNLFARQSQRLSDQMGLRLRQAKVAATWGSQILLYPVYALFQTTRLVSRQIQQTVQQNLPRLRATVQGEQSLQEVVDSLPVEDADLSELQAVDTPILRSLAALETFALPIASSPAALTAAPTVALVKTQTSLTVQPQAGLRVRELTVSKAVNELPVSELAVSASQALTTGETSGQIESLQIRGIASLVDSQRLVLTTAYNQILDILTPQQQIQLQQRIVWELADYWRSRRVLKLEQRQALLPPLSPEQPNLLPPIRLLRRLMAWIQTSPVAIAANLFQESALVEAMLPQEAFTVSEPVWQPSLSQPAAIAPQPLGLSNTWKPRTWKQWVSQALFKGEPSLTGETVDESSLVIAETAALTARPSERSWVEVKSALPPQASLPQASLPQWFKPRRRLAAPRPSVGGRLAPLASPSKAPILAKSAAPAAISQESQPRSLAQVGASAASPASESALTPSNQSSNTPIAAPTWIETEARVVGYIKHPLEQVLEWLDLAMLWVERATERFWRWLRG